MRERLIIELPTDREGDARALYTLLEAYCAVGKHGDEDNERLDRDAKQRERVCALLGTLITDHEASLEATEEGVTDEAMQDFLVVAEELNLNLTHEFPRRAYPEIGL